MCGKKYFGIDFETQRKQFDRDILEQHNRKALWAFHSNIDVVYARIADLRQGGMDAVYKKTRPLLGPTQECPYELVRRVAALIKTRNPILSVTREATTAEIDSIEVREGRKVSRPHYIDEPLAEIAGLPALYPENDLKQLVIMELQVRLDVFRDLDIDHLTFEELKQWVKWANGIEMTFKTAREIVGYGRQLLKAANLAPFLRVLEQADDIGLFRGYLRTLGDIPAEQTSS